MRGGVEDEKSAEMQRIVTGPDPDRFYCPFVGCNRSFAELWRLKVHFRAPPDVRGSGKERGHGTELKYCPKCGKELKPGKHHVGCTAGKSAPRQAAKRQRYASSTSTEDPTSGDTPTGSWHNLVESAVRRRRQRIQANSGDDGHVSKDCQILRRSLDEAPESQEQDLMLLDDIHALPKVLNTDHAEKTTGMGDFMDLNVPRVPSPPPLPIEWDLVPPPGDAGPGFLFDFDQFDYSRKSIQEGDFGPHTTATAAMNPYELSNPSDDYIWQIMFAGANDPVPKRMTAHLHNPMLDRGGSLAAVFDDHPEDVMPANEPVPPPPLDLVMPTEPTEAQEKTVKVTYVVKDGQYSVKEVDRGS